jgi:hypothetical protein
VRREGKEVSITLFGDHINKSLTSASDQPMTLGMVLLFQPVHSLFDQGDHAILKVQ